MIKTPKLLHTIYKNAVWCLPNKTNTIYLTFDDGPTPKVTEKCLDILRKHQVLATFFCVGENVQNNTSIFQKILDHDHCIGNHTFHHLKGWKTEDSNYFSDVEKCNSLIRTSLFRPPYGKVKRSQLKHLSQSYKIIMWDVLSGDFDKNNSEEQIVANVLNNTESGSIIVMHDSKKSGERMLAALPKIIEGLKLRGYNFEKLS